VNLYNEKHGYNRLNFRPYSLVFFLFPFHLRYFYIRYILSVVKPFTTQRCQLILKHLVLSNYEFVTTWFFFKFRTILTTHPIISLNNINWFVCQLQTISVIYEVLVGFF